LGLKQRVPAILAGGFLIVLGVSVLTTGWPCYANTEVTSNSYSQVLTVVNSSSFDAGSNLTGSVNGTSLGWVVSNASKSVTVVPSVMHLDLLGVLMIVLAAVGAYIALYGVVSAIE
jgi:hypothetical protein